MTARVYSCTGPHFALALAELSRRRCECGATVGEHPTGRCKFPSLRCGAEQGRKWSLWSLRWPPHWTWVDAFCCGVGILFALVALLFGM